MDFTYLSSVGIEQKFFMSKRFAESSVYRPTRSIVLPSTTLHKATYLLLTIILYVAGCGCLGEVAIRISECLKGKVFEAKQSATSIHKSLFPNGTSVNGHFSTGNTTISKQHFQAYLPINSFAIQIQ